MKIPFSNLKRLHDSIRPELDEAIKNVIDNNAFIKGEYVTKFEDEFARYCGYRYCVGVGNGTDALVIALKCSGIGEGDAVIVPANSFIATAEAVSLTGAIPIFVDCDENTFLMKESDLKGDMALYVNLFGNSKIWENGIEDCAQAHGAKHGTNNTRCYSFFPGKNLGCFGDGGAIVTNDSNLAEKCRRYANHGRLGKYDHVMVGTNSRLDGLQAAVLSVKLKYLDGLNANRKKIANMYRQAFQGRFKMQMVGDDHVYHVFAICVPYERDELKVKLADNGIACGIHYPEIIPYTPAYRDMCNYPVAYNLSKKLLSLPIDGVMTDGEANYVIEKVLECSNT